MFQTATAFSSRLSTSMRWGRLAEIWLPSGTPLGIYEPRHPVAYDLPRRETGQTEGIRLATGFRRALVNMRVATRNPFPNS